MANAIGGPGTTGGQHSGFRSRIVAHRRAGGADARAPPSCARDDVAAAAAGLIATEGHHGAIYNATGPETLEGAARAAVVAKVTGKPFAFVQVPIEQLLGGLKAAGLPPAVINAVASIEDMWAKGAFDITTGDVARLAGREPSRLIDVAKTYLA